METMNIVSIRKKQFFACQILKRFIPFAMLLTLDNPKVHFHYPRLIATLQREK